MMWKWVRPSRAKSRLRRLKTAGSSACHGGGIFELPFKIATRAASFLIIGMMAAIFLLLFMRVCRYSGNSGLPSSRAVRWNPVSEKFGALASIVGTLVTSFIAVIFGVPLALGSAFFLNELCPFKLRPALTTMIELLAAIPSIIYGMWGLFVLVPAHVATYSTRDDQLFGNIAFCRLPFSGPPVRHRGTYRRTDFKRHDPAVHRIGQSTGVCHRSRPPCGRPRTGPERTSGKFAGK